MRKLLLALIFSAAPILAQAFCFNEAGARYGVNPDLLRAIAKVESGMKQFAINRSNANGSVDVGVMQINSFWFPRLEKLGISREHLWDPCTNVMVGAWILAQEISGNGLNWVSVGRYNSRTPSKNVIYAKKVYAQLRKDGVIR